MAPEMNCPQDGKCIIDPIKLENRLTSIECHLEEIQKLLESRASTDTSTGISGKTVTAISTSVGGILIAIVECIRHYFFRSGGN